MTHKWQWQSLEEWMTSTHIRRRVFRTCVQIASAVPAVIRKDLAASFDSHGGENASGGCGMTHKWQWQSLEEWMTSTHIRRRVLYGCAAGLCRACCDQN